MNKEDYNTEVAVTSNTILCCRCSCNSGCEKNERVVCVHVLPVLFQLSMLLSDGLAQHFLIELANRWDPEIKEIVHEEGATKNIIDSFSL